MSTYINPFWFAAGCANPLISTTSLYEYFKFNEGSGTIAYDSGPNGNRLVVGGGNPQFSGTAIYGGGAWNSGGTEWWSGKTYAPSGAINITSWVWFATGASTVASPAILYSSTSGALDLTINYVNFKLYLERHGVATLGNSTATIPRSAWTHVSVNYSTSSGVYEFYINGAFSSSGTATGTKTFASGTHRVLGGSGSQTSLRGADDLSIWNRNLTASEISTLYNLTCPLSGT